MGTYWGADGKTVDGRYDVNIRSSTGTEPLIGTQGDGFGASNSLYAASRTELFNESTWDRQRGNTQGTLLASAARTAYIPTAIQTNYNAKGIMVFLKVTLASGTGGLKVNIAGMTTDNSHAVYLNATPTLVATTGTYVYTIYPGIGATAGGVTQQTNTVIPRTWWVDMTVGDATSYTYDLTYSLIL